MGRCGERGSPHGDDRSAGKIQVSEDVYERLRDEFLLESRGEIEVKGKGRMPTWFLLARKSLAVVQPLPTQPGELKASD